MRAIFPRSVRKPAAMRVRASESIERPDFSRYVNDPVGFAVDVLGVTPTDDQSRIARAFVVAPFKVKVRAGHNVGKTFLFAWLTLWWYYTRPESVVITTAPTERDVKDLLWTEVRLLHAGAKVKLPNDFIGPSAPEMRSGPDHWAKGYTASKGESFQGRHRANMLFLFDEDDALESIYYDRTQMMFKAGDGHAWGSIGNPYSGNSPSAAEEQMSGVDGSPSWNLFSLSCLEHPNIVAELRGERPPVPNAVSLSQINGMVAEKCQPIHGHRKPTDFEWPPKSGNWHRPGPLFEAGVLGRRPTQGVNAVWSEPTWEAAIKPCGVTPESLVLNGVKPQIGVDVAVYGDDWTTIHSRIGAISLAHSTANGWGPEETAGAIKEECRRLAGWMNAILVPLGHPEVTPEEILVAVELDGYGAGVLSHGRGWAWSGVSASGSPMDKEQFRNVRSELWFTTRDKADTGGIDLSRLPRDVLLRLRQQLMQPTYELNGAGQKDVEPKKFTKKRLKRSPDDADGFNISHYAAGINGGAEWVDADPEQQHGWRGRERRERTE